jgi:hypothetical protein
MRFPALLGIQLTTHYKLQNMLGISPLSELVINGVGLLWIHGQYLPHVYFFGHGVGIMRHNVLVGEKVYWSFITLFPHHK